MKAFLRIILVLAVLAGLAAAAYRPATNYWRERHRPNWQTQTVSRGRIVAVVESTGTVQPVLSVSIGSFVSGPIIEVIADFNQSVKKGDLLARVDPRLFEANVARDEAVLATQQAEVERANALLEQAIRDEQRAIALQNENENFISATEMDSFHFNRLALAAQVRLAEAAVKQATAALENSKFNLDYTKICSPVDGIVIDRKVDPGQTLASQFQTPELFIVAPDMEKKMHVFASVDEADIGFIEQAKRLGYPVKFRVDAYPDDVFDGQIEQIRKNSTTEQNVVTYPVVVAAANPDLKLFPGMTATLYFQVGEKEESLRVPNSVFWFYPQEEHVRPADRESLYAASDEAGDDDPGADAWSPWESESPARQIRRQVWVEDGDFLKAVSIETGLIGSRYTEVVAGDLQEGSSVVTGLRPRGSGD